MQKLESLRFRFPINQPYLRTSYFAEIRPQSIHWGLDLAPLSGNEGTIHAPNTGRILREGWHPVSGWYFWAEIDYIDQRKYRFLTAHMQDRCPLRENEQFDIGQWLGNIGATGNVTGKHAHKEIIDDLNIKRDPELWFENHRLIAENRRLYNKIIDRGGDPNA